MCVDKLKLVVFLHIEVSMTPPKRRTVLVVKGKFDIIQLRTC